MLQVAQGEAMKLEESNEKINRLRQILNETNMTKEAIVEISKSKTGNKMIVPLGSGVFVFAKTENIKQSLVSMPGQAGIIKKNEDIEKDLSKRIENIEQALDKEIQSNQKTALNLNNLSMVLNQQQNRKRPQK